MKTLSPSHSQLNKILSYIPKTLKSSPFPSFFPTIKQLYSPLPDPLILFLIIKQITKVQLQTQAKNSNGWMTKQSKS